MKTHNERNAGRKPLPPGQKRVRLSLTLPQVLAAKVKALGTTKTIEAALNELFNRSK